MVAKEYIEVPYGLTRREYLDNWYVKGVFSGKNIFLSTRTNSLRKAITVLEEVKKDCLEEYRGKKRRIYFIQSGDGPIKIGFSTNIELRLSAIRNWHPYKLTILKLLDGDYEDEHAIHKKFKHVKLTGEWYNPSEDLLKFIQEVNDKNLSDQIDRFKSGWRRRFRLKQGKEERDILRGHPQRV